MRISFAGDQVLTGDEAAHALLDFASVLAKHQTSDEVELRTVQATGDPGISRFLLGPTSQIVISSHASTIAEPDNADIVVSIRRRIDQLTQGGPEHDPPGLEV
ncbi:MAG: hypothetical protein JWR33_2449 [Naasia sp.]|jgi:D-tyrosyl-tRNA(Tyr) deacylase|nr:hypothetical protein [Naasia sp.]